ncbi:hypothetical protein AB0I51_21455 [Streptomyces sp. NPDC050549]|uniref:hypothetical protein n=1 Tax=Streptomyces sp. NPDC050549 TaxID=3155406 RepID=UPI00341A994A
MKSCEGVRDQVVADPTAAAAAGDQVRRAEDLQVVAEEVEGGWRTARPRAAAARAPLACPLSTRKFLREYGESAVLDKLRERWFDRMFTADKAVHCFVGNIAAHPKTFMLLGLFYPKTNGVQYVQDSLFGD